MTRLRLNQRTVAIVLTAVISAASLMWLGGIIHEHVAAQSSIGGGVQVTATITGSLPSGTNTIGSIAPQQASFTDDSGSIAVGGTSQTLAAANTSRRRIVIQNPCTATSQGIAASENLFINFTSAASATSGTSIELSPCGSYDSGFGPVSTEAVTVVAATVSHRYIAKEQ